jgi:hypothetical protein
MTEDYPGMEQVIERLRASKERYEAAEYEDGKDIGSEWAKTVAEYEELLAVTRFNVGASYCDFECARGTGGASGNTITVRAPRPTSSSWVSSLAQPKSTTWSPVSGRATAGSEDGLRHRSVGG